MSCQAERKTIFVKIGRWGSRVTEYAVQSGVDLIQICNTAGIVIAPDEVPFINGHEVVRNLPINSDTTIMLTKKKNITVKVARIGESLSTVTLSDRSTLRNALVSAGRLPFEYEEIWHHRDEIQKGTLVTNIDGLLVDGSIYIIEPKKTLMNKIQKILSSNCEDENGELQKATHLILAMLNKDYNIR